MRFVTYMHDNREIAGIIKDNMVYSLFDLSIAEKGESLLSFIERLDGQMPPDITQNIIDSGKTGENIDGIKLCAPIPRPFRNVICLGKNYADHAKEVAETKLDTQGSDMIPMYPVYFTKNANPATGSGDVIPLHEHVTQKVDYEVELAVIIGKTAKNISPEDVEAHIFGYTILNDVTARDAQTKYGQWYVGKSLDGFCPMGPCIVTRDELKMPLELEIMCKVNGEVRQHSNTKNLIYRIERVISELSAGMTLYPGDIIATGTPSGIGHAKTPPIYLKHGDTVECIIEGIGTLINLLC